MMCMNVDLPEPEGPVTATNSPVWTSRFTPRSARTFDLANDVGLDEVPDRNNGEASSPRSPGHLAHRARARPAGTDCRRPPGAACRARLETGHARDQLRIDTQRLPVQELGERAVGNTKPDIHGLELFVGERPDATSRFDGVTGAKSASIVSAPCAAARLERCRGRPPSSSPAPTAGATESAAATATKPSATATKFAAGRVSRCSPGRRRRRHPAPLLRTEDYRPASPRWRVPGAASLSAARTLSVRPTAAAATRSSAAAAAAAKRFSRHGLIECGEHIAVGRNRSAAEGTRRTSLFWDTSTRRVAVIPGLSFSSELGALMMVA